MPSIYPSSTSTSRCPTTRSISSAWPTTLRCWAAPVGQHALLITLLVSFGSTAAAIVIGLVIAYLIHLFAGRLAGLVTVLVLIPLAVSPVAMALVFSLMLDPLYGPVPQIVALS